MAILPVKNSPENDFSVPRYLLDAPVVLAQSKDGASGGPGTMLHIWLVLRAHNDPWDGYFSFVDVGRGSSEKMGKLAKVTQQLCRETGIPAWLLGLKTSFQVTEQHSRKYLQEVVLQRPWLFGRGSGD